MTAEWKDKQMVKWIGLVLVFVGLSVMTSGLVSALMDLAAFLLLLFAVARKAMKKSTEPTEENFSVNASEAGTENKDRIDIAP